MKHNLGISILLIFLFYTHISLITCTDLEELVWNKIIDNISNAPGAKNSFSFKSLNEKNEITKLKSKLENNIKAESKSETSQMLIEGWLSLNSKDFADIHKYYPLPLPDGTETSLNITSDFGRLNPKYDPNSKNDIPGPTYFWFKLAKDYLYYSLEKADHVLGVIEIINVYKDDKNNTCFDIEERGHTKYHLCALNEDTRDKWVCFIEITVYKKHIFDCSNINKLSKKKRLKLELQTRSKIGLTEVIQPLIIIPQASSYANANWNYNKRGNDWEGTCREGNEQSPVDLPLENIAIASAVKPLFQYEVLDNIATETNLLGMYKTGENIKIIYDNYALRIYSNNFGRLVTVSGSVYLAEEIVFHTPSEHTINSNRFDMEMQVIHNGISKGDYGKKAILCFLFKSKPGKYNKLLEKLDFFNLPNPLDKVRDILYPLFIPHILYESEDMDITMTPPFSFYTYQGSISEPPCIQNTIVYVASNVIEVSVTILELFKESLRIPDQEDDKGNVFISDINPENYRGTQPLNGRAVFHYDHTKYNCPEFVKKKKDSPLFAEDGHYEKRPKTITDYFFVSGDAPSGIANSFVVSEEEARGK
jgi:carbonic anhydrase